MSMRVLSQGSPGGNQVSILITLEIIWSRPEGRRDVRQVLALDDIDENIEYYGSNRIHPSEAFLYIFIFIYCYYNCLNTMQTIEENV